MLRKNRAVAAVMLCSLIATACQDLATGSGFDRRMSRTSPTGNGRETLLKSLYICNTSDLHPAHGHPYTYTRASLRFPTQELASDGGTQEVHLRIRSPANLLVAAANCRIPNTRAAAERLYRTFERVFAGRATLDPMEFRAQEEKRRKDVNPLDAQGVSAAGGPRFSDVPIAGVTATVSGVPEGGATGWTGMTDWGGWGSQGDGATYGGSGDSPEPEPAPAVQGPILALILCLGGLLGVGFTIDDVEDQMRTLISDKEQKESDERMYQMYVQQAPSLQIDTERAFLEYLMHQSESKYNDDVHQLALKLKLSDYAMAMAILGCAASLAAPTP